MFLDMPVDIKPLEKRIKELEDQLADRTHELQEAQKVTAPPQPTPVTTHKNDLWQTVECYGDYITDRAQVPGGWLVRMIHSYGDARAGAPLPNITFVPDPLHTWVYVNRSK